jgi:AraC-like DNA-binding protein/ligand-binding sensor protein
MQDGLLQKAIKCLSLNNKFHIAVHDVSGVIHNTPALKLPAENTIHSSPFCNAAKITPEGLRSCLRCKYWSIKKALRTGAMYSGQCYFGLYEIVSPVFFNDQLVCIIYLGNFIKKGEKHTVIERINKRSYLGRNNRELLLEAAGALHEADTRELEGYGDIAGVLSDIITLVLGSSGTKYKYKNSISPIFNTSKSWIVESITNNIHAYYNRDLKLSQFASMYFVNPQYLCRLFRKETGMNFSAYLNRIRVDNAKNMLKRTNDSITSIAMQTGFNNVTYFNRVFKKLEGTSPGEYRARD